MELKHHLTPLSLFSVGVAFCGGLYYNMKLDTENSTGSQRDCR